MLGTYFFDRSQMSFIDTKGVLDLIIIVLILFIQDLQDKTINRSSPVNYNIYVELYYVDKRSTVIM